MRPEPGHKGTLPEPAGIRAYSFLFPTSASILQSPVMDAALKLLLALDPSEILRAQGMTPVSWQRDFLLSETKQVQLLCCRGAGQSGCSCPST